MHERYLQCWPYFSPFLGVYNLFTVSLGVKVKCTVMSFLDIWSIRWSSSMLRLENGLSIFRGSQPKCLLLWLYFSNAVWFRVVSRSIEFFIFILFFYLRLFDAVRFQYFQIFESFRFFECIFLDFIVIFLPLFVFLGFMVYQPL